MATTQQSTEEERLLREHAELFPANPLFEHTPPSDRTFEDIALEKRTIHSKMLDAADEFVGTSRELVKSTADLALLFHHNQFRSGVSPTPHYTSHTSEVGYRAGMAIETFPDDFPIINDAKGEQINPKAIVIALGRLHDAIEDFGTNFNKEIISNELAGQVAAAKIRRVLTKVIGSTAADEIVIRVKGLSLDNDEEFPDKNYVNRIAKDPYMRCCKGADYDHNLETFPGYTEAYPLLIVPAQYSKIVEGTRFEESYNLKLLNCLHTFNSYEYVPWEIPDKGPWTRTTDHIKDLFVKYDELNALSRLKTYYEQIGQRLHAGDFDTYLESQDITRIHLVLQLEALLLELA